MPKPATPILVAAAQLIDRDTSGRGQRPLELISAACREAAADAGSQSLLESVDDIAVLGLTIDAPQAKSPISGGYRNPPKSIANALSITPKRYYYSGPGGNTPQSLVNHFSRKISRGEAETVLLAGGETLATMMKAFDRWYKWLLPKGDWKDNPGGKAELLGSLRASGSAYEDRHGLDLPANVYPLFENALQHHYGRSVDEHRKAIGQLFAGLSEAAADNPYAWFKQARSVEELIDVTSSNRMVGFPYTKRLNSMIIVNQAAALVLTSTEKAKSLGIPEDKWVYLHGFADASDIWNVSERENFHSSPAMRLCAERALAMAEQSIDAMSLFDIYSCFPSAVQIACDEFGIAHDDPRGLSLTGGLPYFGGPGNNYSLLAIAEMVQQLRTRPGEFGLLNANGWFLTKHALGIYSTAPADPARYVQDPASYELEVSSVAAPATIEAASGPATIETFTVLHNQANQPERAIIIGRDSQQRRFVANSAKDPELFSRLCQGDAIGQQGQVINKGGKNLFSFA